MKFRKKQIVILAAVAVICVSVYLNWRFNGGVSDVADAGRSLGQAQLVSSDGALVSVDSNEDIPVDSLPAQTPVSLDVRPVVPDDEAADSSADVLAASSYFAEARMERKQSRDESIEILKEIAGNIENSQEVRNKAAQDMGLIALNIERESNIETIIKSKGFEDCVAVLSADSIYLVVKTPGLMEHEVAQIREVVTAETGFGADKIKIIEVK